MGSSHSRDAFRARCQPGLRRGVAIGAARSALTGVSPVRARCCRVVGAVQHLGAGEGIMVEVSACCLAFPVWPQFLVRHNRIGRVADSAFSSALAGCGRYQSQPQSLQGFVASDAHLELADRTVQSAHGTMRVHPSMDRDGEVAP